MKKLFLLVLLFLSFSFARNDISLDNIRDLNWENRIILIWTEKELDILMSKLHSNDYEIKDRDIIWFIIKKDKLYSNYKGSISKDFIKKTNKKYFNKNGNVLLIGKDGGVKDISQSLDLKDIFRQIDGMPMRQIEMKNQR